jgi:hypothetical protein
MIKSSINPNYVNTSEAYSMSIFVGKGNIVVPYINIDLLDQNGILDQREFISFSYYILTDVKSIILQAPQTVLNLYFADCQTESLNEECIQIGGYKSKGLEAAVICQGFLICIPNYAQYSKEPLAFVPVDTPNTKRNMPTENIDLFFSLGGIDAEIKNEFLGNDAAALTISL